MKRYLTAFAALLALALPGNVAATAWSIDSTHSSIGFQISKLMLIGVEGHFSRYTSTLDINEEDITRSQVSVTIDPASIDTGNTKRDEHLRSADYFDVARYPAMTFESKRVVKVGEGRYQLSGDLTIRGVTREVTLDMEKFTPPGKDQAGHLRCSATATAKVNRKDFGLRWDSVLEKLMALGNEVTIIIAVEMIQAQGR